jgi:hypothetical protein
VPVIFRRSRDTQLRQGVVGIILGLGLGVFAWYYYALPSYTRVGYTPVQPVAFSHQLHVGQLGMDCTYCHQHVFHSPHATVPSAQVCMNCHNPRKANVKGNSPLLALIRESYETGKPVAWKRVHKLPEYAYFNHAVHVNKGVSCVSCHGLVNEMPIVRHDQPLSMGWCLQCHHAPEEHLRPVEQVTNLSWKPEGGKPRLDIGWEIKQQLQVQAPLHCQGCHR